MDFAKFDAHIRQVSDLIIHDQFFPDAIVGISRGGWIPARLFSKYLKVKKLYSYGMTYTDEERTTLSVYQDIHITKDIHKVLAVEDFLESGKSMKKAMGDIKSNDLDARTACLGYLEKTVIMPNYSLGLMAEAPKFPWD